MTDYEAGAGVVERLQARIAALEAQLGRRREGLPTRDELLRRVFEDAPIGMALVGTDERLVEVNAALCRMLGYTRDELLALTVPALTHPDDQTLEARPKAEMVDGVSSTFVIEKRYVRKDGSWLRGRLSVTALLDEHGRPEYYLGQLEDVTRERAAEAALDEQREQLAQARRLDSLGRLAGGVAHDFNNMLAVILGMAESLAEDTSPQDPRGQDIALIRETALRARDLTAQLLAIGRRQLVQPTTFDVAAHVRELERLLQRLLGEDIPVTLITDGAAHTRMDPTQLQQALLNIASNARDAMPLGGRFTVRVSSRQHASPRGDLPPGRYVRVDLEDTGTGMSPEVLQHAFDPFFTTKAVGKGTGLGLATVYAVITQAGGHVTLHSELGRGTRFSLYLPKAVPEPATPEVGAASPTHAPGSARGRVLVVEDDDAVRRTTLRILQRAGYEVVPAERPGDALALIERRGPGVAPFDALVVDVVMPGMSGPQLYEQVAARCGAIPVVFVSGYAKATTELSGRPGATLLLKPFTADALVSTVETVRQQCAPPRPDAPTPRLPAGLAPRP